MTDYPSIPGYKITRRLGRGGMATVFLAVQESMGREVALKVMASHLTEDNIWAKRFIHEAQVIAQLSHPSIVPVFDVGTHDGKFFISMEYLHGGSLKSRMTQLMPIPEVLKIVAGVAAGLDYAGEKGFVHRDIKPDNIMFREDGSPVILDFGIVKQMSEGASQMTQTGVIVGTTLYMSPEQAQGRDLDGRSDIYSLGVMLYEMFTGSPPFKGETDVATLLMHINEPPPPLPDDLRELQPIIDKCLAKDPFERYARARELIDHLEELEPQIKEMLTKRRIASPSEPTRAKPAVGEDATMVVNTTSRHSKVTTEEELTKVLSSAKATIKDFSAETRERKARRTKRVIATASFVAISAVAFLGYHQLHVVPMERAAAEQRIRDAEMKTQHRIKELLVMAEHARRGLKPSDYAEVDKVISAYREILQLNPDNLEAKVGLEKIGERYLELANKAMEYKDIEKAETYREYVQQLNPRHPELALLNTALKTARAELLDDQFKEERINTLLDVAQKDIESSEGFSDSAYTKLQQVLGFDEKNERANDLLENMLEKTFSQTKTFIADGRLTRARENLDILAKYYEEPERLLTLEETLRKASARITAQQNQSNLLTKASHLERERRTITVNENLRGIYLQVLESDARNKEAINGLKGVSDFDLNMARKAIEDRDFVRAKQQIALVEKTSPKHAALTSVKRQLSTAEKNVATVQRLIEKINQHIATDQTGESKRKELKLAISDIEKAQKLDPKNPELNEALKSLESAYVTTISQHIAEENRDLVDGYFTDTAGQAWPSDRILQLQLSQKKTKPKRVITGGF